MVQKNLFMSSKNFPVLRRNGGIESRENLIGRIDINNDMFSGILGSKKRNRDAYFFGVPERLDCGKIEKLYGFLVNKDHSEGGIVIQSVLKAKLCMDYTKKQFYRGNIYQSDPRDCRIINLNDYFTFSSRAKMLLPKKNKKEQFSGDFMDAYQRVIYMAKNHEPIGELEIFMAKDRDNLFVDL